MIDESIGKILGMAMAYGVSALGLFLAYANYRKRTVGAEKVMTPKAWGVVAVVVLAVVGGVLVVAELAQPPAATDAQEMQAQGTTEPEPETIASMDFEEPDAQPIITEKTVPEGTVPEEVAAAASDEERARWPLIGILLPALIFLAATWITAGLYRHFSTVGGAPESRS